MASRNKFKDAAAALHQALLSSNTQDAVAAQAIYEKALGDEDAAPVDLDPLKRDLAASEEGA